MKMQILSSPAKLLISLRSVSTQLSCAVFPMKHLLLNMGKLKEKLGGGVFIYLFIYLSIYLFIYLNTAVDL